MNVSPRQPFATGRLCKLVINFEARRRYHRMIRWNGFLPECFTNITTKSMATATRLIRDTTVQAASSDPSDPGHDMVTRSNKTHQVLH